MCDLGLLTTPLVNAVRTTTFLNEENIIIPREGTREGTDGILSPENWCFLKLLLKPMILLSEANEPKNAKSSSIVYTSLEAIVIITTVALI